MTTVKRRLVAQARPPLEWKAIVKAIDKDMLTVKWRDYPTFPRFSVHRNAVALLKPAAADA